LADLQESIRVLKRTGYQDCNPDEQLHLEDEDYEEQVDCYQARFAETCGSAIGVRTWSIISHHPDSSSKMA
jgi:hypothetical protein